MRPVVSHSSAGVSTGANHSCAPIASSSSRMICSIFRCTRQPSGVNVQMPRRKLPHETPANEQLVADRVGVGRRITQRRQKEL